MCGSIGKLAYQVPPFQDIIMHCQGEGHAPTRSLGSCILEAHEHPPLSSTTVGVMLHRMPNRHIHLCSEILWDVLRMATKASCTLSSHFSGRLRWCLWVSIPHPRNTLLVDQAASPCRSFFTNIGYFCNKSLSLLGKNTMYTF